MGDGIPSALTAGRETVMFHQGPAGPRGVAVRPPTRSYIRTRSAAGRTPLQVKRPRVFGICVGLRGWGLPIKNAWSITGTPTSGFSQGGVPGGDGAVFFWRNGHRLTDKNAGTSIGVRMREELAGVVADARCSGEPDIIVASGGGPEACGRYARVEGKRDEDPRGR
jgi:hypothetical protein